MHLLMQDIWGEIWKCTEKTLKNNLNQLPLFGQPASSTSQARSHLALIGLKCYSFLFSCPSSSSTDWLTNWLTDRMYPGLEYETASLMPHQTWSVPKLLSLKYGAPQNFDVSRNLCLSLVQFLLGRTFGFVVSTVVFLLQAVSVSKRLFR